MTDQDDNETQGVVFGVLAAVIFGVIALVVGLATWQSMETDSASPAKAVVAVVEEVDIAPVGDALAKIYFAVGESMLGEADRGVVAQTIEALGKNSEAIVLLSGFHDASGDPVMNAELAKKRALSVRDALVAGGVAVERIKMRKPESTVGSGSAEEGRRVEIRVQ